MGSVGPVAARVESSTRRVRDPRDAPTAAVPVTGPSAAVGVVSVDVVVGGGASAGWVAGAFPRGRSDRVGSGSIGVVRHEGRWTRTDVRTPIARCTRGRGARSGSLAAWSPDGAARCVFSNVVGGGGARPRPVFTRSTAPSRSRLRGSSPRASSSGRGSSVEAVGSVEIDSGRRPSSRGCGRGWRFRRRRLDGFRGENAVFDVDGAGFFPGLTCVWCGVAARRRTCSRPSRCGASSRGWRR